MEVCKCAICRRSRYLSGDIKTSPSYNDFFYEVIKIDDNFDDDQIKEMYNEGVDCSQVRCRSDAMYINEDLIRAQTNLVSQVARETNPETKSLLMSKLKILNAKANENFEELIRQHTPYRARGK